MGETRGKKTSNDRPQCQETRLYSLAPKKADCYTPNYAWLQCYAHVLIIKYHVYGQFLGDGKVARGEGYFLVIG